MNTKVRFSIGLFLLFWLAFPVPSFGKVPGTIQPGEYIDASKQTWMQYEKPVIDPLGHPTYPWLPKDPYPFTQPYTADELMHHAVWDHKHFGSKYIDYAIISARLNKRGLMTQRKGYVKMESKYDSYKDAYEYDMDQDGKVKVGDLFRKQYVIYETPADVRGTSQIAFFFLNSPVHPWRMTDAWNYSPGLRRVTRSQGGDRQDERLGTPITFDDSGDRQVYEERHKLIGEDVLYEQFLDPQIVAPDRLENTGDMKIDGEWFRKNLDPSRGEEKLNPYRPDGGIECWVVLSDWARYQTDPPYGSQVYKDPKNYYLKKQITWIEKVTKSPVRVEQYDHDDRMIKNGYSLNNELYKGHFKDGGGTNRTQYQMYDYRRNFRAWGSYDRADLGPKFKAPDDWYTPDHLFREYFWKKVKVPMYKSIKEFCPPPALYRAKFPEYRKGSTNWLSKEDLDYIAGIWKEHGYTDEEIDAVMNGDGVIRKDGKLIPVRKNTRPAHIHGKPLMVKFPVEGPYVVRGGKIESAK